MSSTSCLRQWMQKNECFDKDLLSLFPKYGINDPDNDLYKLSDENWSEIQNIVLNEKRAELKDTAANLRFKKKLTKITKIWKEERKKNNMQQNKTKSTSKIKTKTKTKTNKKISIKQNRDSKKIKTPTSDIMNDTKNEIEIMEELRNENKKIRRELSTKNSDFNRLQQEFNLYKNEKDDEIKRLNNKLKQKEEEYEKLLRNYKQINQRINSKYHDNSAKDKEIVNLKNDKSTLLNDINEVMKGEQVKYNKLLTKYEELKIMNNRNLKYKLRYKKEKNRQKKHNKRAVNYTVDLNAVDIEKIKEMDDNDTDSSNNNDNNIYYDDDDDDDDGDDKKNNDMIINENDPSIHSANSISNDLLKFEKNKPKTRKYKPSKEKRARARQLSEIVTTNHRKKKKNHNV